MAADPPLYGSDQSRFARYLERREARSPDPVARELRRRLLAGLRGRVLELGCGDGRAFEHYPPAVTGVLAVEPDPTARSVAAERAQEAPVPIEVVEGSASALPAGAGAFDAAVIVWVLCSVPDPNAALQELRRVLAPGGELRFYEHVRAEDPRHARSQDRINRVWPRFAGGCHPNRDTPAAIEAAGFEIERCDRFKFKPVIGMKAIEPHVIGIARRT
jgi:SAM-dependent methyltransferase